MRIGIVAPCPSPYAQGLPEHLWRSLRDYINSETAHQCDIVKLPFPTQDFWSRLKAYRQFAELDLSGFDVVISGQAPAWMVDHPRHIVLVPDASTRSGPDRTHSSGTSFHTQDSGTAGQHPALRNLSRLLGMPASSRIMLPRLFDTLAGIEACATSAVQLQWPDPLAQAVLNHLDAVALSSVQLRQHPLQATGFDLPEEDATAGLNDACPAPRVCTVSPVRWEALLEDCLTPSIATNTSPYEWGSRGLPKLVVLTTFSIFPPRHGGQARVFHLYRQLARWFDITIVSTTQAGHTTREQLIAPGLREIRVSKSRKHQQQELALRRALGVPIEDVAMLGFWQDSPELIDTIREACADAWRVITCHPYHYPLLREHIKTPFWYEAQDVEAQIKTAILPQGERSRPWLEKVAAAEAACCAEAEYVLTCSPEDALELQRRYQLTADKCVMVPNGTDVEAIGFAPPARRLQLRQRLFGAQPVSPQVLFMGSGHHPNLEAVQQVFKFADACRDMQFLIMGSCCGAFNPDMKPENVAFLGELSESERLVVLEMVDIAINPMLTGSGTNLKMIDFLVAGIPTLSSEIGARGLGLEDGVQCLIKPIDQFPATLRNLVRDDKLQEQLSSEGNLFVHENFSWALIVERAFGSLASNLQASAGSRASALREAGSHASGHSSTTTGHEIRT